MHDKQLPVQRPIKYLSSAWQVRIGINGRIYYYSLHSHTVQILPPPESWSCAFNLPYGWEYALDYEDKPYFINHVLQTVTYKDPRLDEELSSKVASCPTPSGSVLPAPREYVIPRDSKLGFGFIAGSEKPVIIRSVSPGGPSEGKLLPGDQIIKIASEYVKGADRELVINLIRGSTDSVTLTVLQPTRVPNSSFLKPNKRSVKGMNRPRVRFADDSGSDGDEKGLGSSSLIAGPGKLRVLLEEGQSQIFEFNHETTAGDIVSTLCENLGINDSKLYSLVLTPCQRKERRDRQFSRTTDEILIAPWDSIAKTLTNPSVRHHECHFRLTFVSKDIHKLSSDDPRSFRYHYVQCVNDVVSGEVYTNDISLDEALRLASFQMLETYLSQLVQRENGVKTEESNSSRPRSFRAPNKISLKQIEKEFGLSKFLSPSVLNLVNSNQTREHRRALQQCLKVCFANYVSGNSSGRHASSPTTIPTNERPLTLGEKLHRLRLEYVKILSPHHLYAGRYFPATILALRESDITLIVGHHYGISQLVNSKTKMASIFADFTLVTSVEVAPCSPEASKTNVRVEFKDMAPLVLAMHPLSAQNFAFMISGYCRVYDNNDMMLTLPIAESTSAPEYFSLHKVKMSHWNYPPEDGVEPANSNSFFYADFSEPIRSSLLSGNIPDSARAMFQQSKIDELEEEEKDDDERGDKSDENSDPEADRALQEDGGNDAVAELSPLSSASSMTSSSAEPASPQLENRVALLKDSQPEQNEKDEKSSETMTTLHHEVDASRDGGDCDVKSEASVNFDKDNEVSSARNSISSSLSSTKRQNSDDDLGGSAASKDESRVGDFLSSEKEVAETETRTDGSVTSGPSAAAASETSETGDELSKASVRRHRFSSFKPGANDEDDDNDGSSRRTTSEASSSGKLMTSDQLQARLESSALKVNADLSSGDHDDEDQATSPLPVNDLASGHKVFKESRKAKNRRSWFGGSSLPRSYSLDAGLAKSQEEKRKSRSVFRGFFPSRGYSVEKGRSPDEDARSRPTRSRWGRIFKSSESSSGRSRFSFFRLFSRKKRRRTVNIHSREVASPLANDAITGGVYSVFRHDSPSSESARGENSMLERSISVENVKLRDTDDRTTSKPRPVSFMTFQRVPADYTLQRSPSTDGGGDLDARRNLSPKAQARFRMPDPKLPISAVKLASLERQRSSSSGRDSVGSDPNSPKASSSTRSQPKYENWGGLTPPPKPVRRPSKRESTPSVAPRVIAASNTTVCDGGREQDAVAKVSVSSASDSGSCPSVAHSQTNRQSKKKRAPPPPKPRPREISKSSSVGDSAAAKSIDEEVPEKEEEFQGKSIAEAENLPTDDANVAETSDGQVFVEPLDLGQLDSSSDEEEDDAKLENSPTPDRQSVATLESEGSLVGEIMACLRDDRPIEKESLPRNEEAARDIAVVETSRDDSTMEKSCVDVTIEKSLNDDKSSMTSTESNQSLAEEIPEADDSLSKPPVVSLVADEYLESNDVDQSLSGATTESRDSPEPLAEEMQRTEDSNDSPEPLAEEMQRTEDSNDSPQPIGEQTKLTEDPQDLTRTSDTENMADQDSLPASEPIEVEIQEVHDSVETFSGSNARETFGKAEVVSSQRFDSERESLRNDFSAEGGVDNLRTEDSTSQDESEQSSLSSAVSQREDDKITLSHVSSQASDEVAESSHDQSEADAKGHSEQESASLAESNSADTPIDETTTPSDVLDAGEESCSGDVREAPQLIERRDISAPGVASAANSQSSSSAGSAADAVDLSAAGLDGKPPAQGDDATHDEIELDGDSLQDFPPPPAHFLDFPSDIVAHTPAEINGTTSCISTTTPVPTSPAGPTEMSLSDKDNFEDQKPDAAASTLVPNGSKSDIPGPQPAYHSLVTPRLFGQNVAPRPFSKVKVPVSKPSSSSDLLSNVRPAAFRYNGAPSGFKSVKHVIGPSKPALPPKPSVQ